MECKNSLILHQVRANSRLSYHELTNTFSENCEIHLSSNTVRNILLRKKIGVYAAIRKPMVTNINYNKIFTESTITIFNTIPLLFISFWFAVLTS